MNDIQQAATPPTPVASQQPKALRVLANIVSYVCHPVFMPTVMTFVLYKLSPTSFIGVKHFNMLLISIGLITIFFPLLSILLMKGLGFVESIQLHTAKDRIIPMIATMIFYFWAAHVYDNVAGTPLIVQVLLLGAFWEVIVLFMFNIFVKVSLHTGGAGGMIGVLIVLMITSPVNMTIPLFVAIIIAGIIGSARLILGAHIRGEIWAGYITGILMELAAYWYLK
jgi:hypothetical protein